MVPKCHHIDTSGGKCGSPALREELYCYFHDPIKQRAGNPSVCLASTLSTDLLDLEDPRAIQQALTEFVRAVVENRLEPRRAGLILYALQIASANAKKRRTRPPRNCRIDTASY